MNKKKLILFTNSYEKMFKKDKPRAIGLSGAQMLSLITITDYKFIEII